MPLGKFAKKTGVIGITKGIIERKKRLKRTGEPVEDIPAEKLPAPIVERKRNDLLPPITRQEEVIRRPTGEIGAVKNPRTGQVFFGTPEQFEPTIKRAEIEGRKLIEPNIVLEEKLKQEALKSQQEKGKELSKQVGLTAEEEAQKSRIKGGQALASGFAGAIPGAITGLVAGAGASALAPPLAPIVIP